MPRLSDSAAARLRAELEDLSTRQRAAAQAAIDESRSAGDIAENPDFFVAAAEYSRVETRIEQLTRLLAEHDAAPEESTVPSGVAGPGSIVTLSFAGGAGERFLIGSIEERPEDMDVLSASSPLGTAVIGHRAGDIVSFEAPGGLVEVTVLAVE